ncbi:cell surface A33 antigen [Chanos chanos]|uniref:Cell surface A33 antigen n=1 Tax=Chanos chanos TaxID=29144 RepID=A0A6J2WGK9_CHACN|nr:cell surface A33 antigen-like [Chanos chanos]
MIKILSNTWGLHVSMAQPSLETAQGKKVILTCTFHPKSPVNSLIIITWSGEPRDLSDESITFGTYYSNDGHIDIGPDYEGKASIETDLDQKVSRLTLNHVTVQESRDIKCQVQIPGDDEGQTFDTTNLVVLVPPSDPVCEIKGATEYGHDISLTCVSEEGSPTPTYQWQGYDVSNLQRPFPPKTTQQNGVLSLFNMSREMSGYYVCTSTNKMGSAKCNVTLAVMPSTMNIASTAGIFGGCAAGVLVLVIIIYCCCCRKKEKDEEHATNGPVVEYHDRPPTEHLEDQGGDKRKGSVEGSIDRRDQYEEHSEKSAERRNSSDILREKNVVYRSKDRLNDPDDYNDQRDRYYDRRDRYDDRDNRYDGRRDRYDDRDDRYDDRRDRYDDRHDRYVDRHDRYDNRQDHYDDHTDY